MRRWIPIALIVLAVALLTWVMQRGGDAVPVAAIPAAALVSAAAASQASDVTT